MNTTTPLDRPLPRSYMTEEKRNGLMHLGQDTVFVFESQAADEAGDDEAGWAWLALAELPQACKDILKIGCNEEFLKAKGFRL